MGTGFVDRNTIRITVRIPYSDTPICAAGCPVWVLQLRRFLRGNTVTEVLFRRLSLDCQPGGSVPGSLARLGPGPGRVPAPLMVSRIRWVGRIAACLHPCNIGRATVRPSSPRRRRVQPHGAALFGPGSVIHHPLLVVEELDRPLLHGRWIARVVSASPRVAGAIDVRPRCVEVGCHRLRPIALALGPRRRHVLDVRVTGVDGSARSAVIRGAGFPVHARLIDRKPSAGAAIGIPASGHVLDVRLGVVDRRFRGLVIAAAGLVFRVGAIVLDVGRRRLNRLCRRSPGVCVAIGTEVCPQILDIGVAVVNGSSGYVTIGVGIAASGDTL